MRKLIAFIVILCATMEMAIAQPIKSTIGMGVQSYNPPVYVITNNPVPGPRGPRGYQGQTLTVRDTIRVQPDLSKYALNQDVVSLNAETARNVDNIYLELDALRYQLAYTDSIYNVQLNNAQNNMTIHKLKNRGWTKIISGAGLQVIAVGLLAYSDIDIVQKCVRQQEIPIGYQITEYELVEIPAKFKKCDIPKYQVIPTIVDKTTKIVIKDYYPCITERNKTAYQISAGILAGAGLALEILGIIDLHDAHVQASSEGIGIAVNF